MWSGISSVGSATRPSGNSGKSRTSATGLSLRPPLARTREVSTTALVWFRRDLRVHDHPALDRGAPRVRPRRAGLRARPAAARRALPVPQPRVVPARLPRRAARGAARARRRPRDPRGPARGGAARARARVRRDARSTSPPTSRRSPAPATAAWRRRSTSRCARSPGCSSPTTRRRQALLGLHAVPPSVGAARAPRGPRRPARADASRAGSPSAACPPRPEPEARRPLPARRARRARAREPLARRRPRALRGAPRPARGRDVAALALPALRLHLRRASSRRARSSAAADAFVRQLAWRDFYAHVLLHNPGNTRHAHKREYDRLEWDDDEELLDAWREGRTGYPVVDAAMRQLLAHRLDAQPRRG